MSRDNKPSPPRDEDDWFVPKLFGIGATPATWQGWALTLGTIGLVVLDMRFVEPRLTRLIVAAGLILALTAISWHKTAGGWRWRWGTRD
ncbi:hypothetical protein [Hephaestia mangrovi]|uniref:hypothetical protein n=1 Tax=Hephaestia mangrovi TaxID=2873268 RepID=UPI001CA6BBFE|nr:hypothetical protein [Hephaestia mangrovi]MBY8828165.1 hypothetical protein [Hephaestia mangrovi]